MSEASTSAARAPNGAVAASVALAVAANGNGARHDGAANGRGARHDGAANGNGGSAGHGAANGNGAGRHAANPPGLAPAVALPPDSAPPAWTAPPDEGGPLARAERGRRARHEALERRLAESAQALTHARANERAVRAARAADTSTLAILTAQLEAERIAHAVTRATSARLVADLATTRAELTAAKLRRPDIQRRAHALAEAAAATRPAPNSSRLLADLDAAAAALRLTTLAEPEAPPPVDAAAAAALGGAGLPGAANGAAPLAPDGVAPTTRAADTERRLRRALVEFARADPLAAGRLLIALLPAQAAVLDGPLSYDLTVRGLGTFAVSVADKRADVARLRKPRRRGEARFHLRVEALALAELLAGERARIGRFRGAARANRRKRTAGLAPLASAKLSLADAVRAGARLDPELVYAALPFAVDAEWTRGHAFTVAQEIAHRTWFVTARDGEPLAVSQDPPVEPPDATVTLTAAAFDALLRDEPPAAGERPAVRGDHAAVAALKGWTDRARGIR